MYKGRRDPEVSIIVPRDFCSIYRGRQGKDWVEIQVPPEVRADYRDPWGIMMVDPEQVDFLDEEYNVVRVNDKAKIVSSRKDMHRRVVWGEEIEPVEIIGRFLKYYHASRFKTLPYPEPPSIAFYRDMRRMGQGMEAYMNRLPYRLPYVKPASPPVVARAREQQAM